MEGYGMAQTINALIIHIEKMLADTKKANEITVSLSGDHSPASITWITDRSCVINTSQLPDEPTLTYHSIMFSSSCIEYYRRRPFTFTNPYKAFQRLAWEDPELFNQIGLIIQESINELT